MADEDKLVVGNITLIEVGRPPPDEPGRPLVPAYPPVVHTHPWNVAPPPLPVPEPPKPAPRYRLTMQHNSEKRTGSDEPVSIRAECDTRETLLDLNAQCEAIDYHFVRLELIEQPPA
jgi:hypothetical protein